MVGLLEGPVVGLVGPNRCQGRDGLSIPAGELRPQLLFQLPFAEVQSRVGGRVGHLAHHEDPGMGTPTAQAFAFHTPVAAVSRT